jgi:hypothetical protein
MKTSKRSSNLRRYRNLTMDAVLALLSASRDDEYFVAPRIRSERRMP